MSDGSVKCLFVWEYRNCVNLLKVGNDGLLKLEETSRHEPSEHSNSVAAKIINHL